MPDGSASTASPRTRPGPHTRPVIKHCTPPAIYYYLSTIEAVPTIRAAAALHMVLKRCCAGSAAVRYQNIPTPANLSVARVSISP